MLQTTPMMQQYLEIKEQYKDCILFFRLGDFYEMFFDDAIIASKELEITLTGKDCGMKERAPMCGVPFHAADNYVARLIEKGYKVAICEQTEDPKQAKGIVKREVIRIVTPGTVTDTNVLEEKNNNYIACIYREGFSFGLSVADISTGEFSCTKFSDINSLAKLVDELARFVPAEIIGNETIDENIIMLLKQRFNSFIWSHNDNAFLYENAKTLILSQIPNCEGIDDNENRLAVCSAGALLDYLNLTQKINLSHINKLEIYQAQKYMMIDISTRRNLEISETLRERAKKGSLLWVLDKTQTSMGARLLKRWVDRPLIDVKEINQRLDTVEELKNDFIKRAELADTLKLVYDVERLITKIVYGNANSRDLIALKNSIAQLPQIKEMISTYTTDMMRGLYINLDLLTDIHELIEKAIIDEPPVSIKEGGIIKIGYNEDVDKLRSASTEGKNWIAALESKERERTGIKNLKISYNRIFGYYIEITKSNYDSVPNDYMRKQTLANCERFVTEELKTMEEEILGSYEKAIELEYNLFCEVRYYIASNLDRLKRAAEIVATIDVFTSLATIAENNNYIRPSVDDNDIINIKEGRHPVIEKMIKNNEFIANDTYLDIIENKINIITGPNMAGKSTYMRQVALIVLMSQIGSFVPAECAQIGICDRIFTRVGASDDLSMGQSTFMVEMSELANILINSTQRSLIILDEIGRGTSTYDGLSIAWAVVEYLSEKVGARTLFATHYHELTELEGKVEGVKNYCILVREKGEDIIFLRKIVLGGADESYGIHVAKLAGVPYGVINRAKELLNQLADADISKKAKKDAKNNIKAVPGQVDLFNYKIAEVANQIAKIDIMSLTPIDALNILSKLKEKLG